MKDLILISFLFLSCYKEVINEPIEETVIINKFIGEYKHESGTIADNPKGNMIITKDSLKVYGSTYKVITLSDTELIIYDNVNDNHIYDRFVKDGDIYKLRHITQTNSGNIIFLKIK